MDENQENKMSLISKKEREAFEKSNAVVLDYYVGKGNDRDFVLDTIYKLRQGEITSLEVESLLDPKPQNNHHSVTSETVGEYNYEADDCSEEEDEANKTPAKKRKGKLQLTINDLIRFLNENDIFVRRNEIKHRLEISGEIANEFDSETIDSSLHTILHDRLKLKYSCTSGLIADQLNVIGGMFRFNPVLDAINDSPKCDGQNHYEEVYEILNLPEVDTLSRILIKKWLWQAYSLLNNDENKPFGGDGMLVLVGPQGTGKTLFCGTIGMGFTLTGQYIDFSDKDSIIRSTGSWITELAELESTFRTDREKLKAFVTSGIDRYRKPYARGDCSIIRRTSFIGTANTEQLLIDETGSRRYWVIPITEINLEKLNKLNVPQLWRQVQRDVLMYGDQAFRLTPLERKQLEQRNANHQAPIKSELEIRDILSDVDSNPSKYSWTDMTVSDFKQEYDILKSFDVRAIGRALDRLGYTSKKKKVNGESVRTRNLPKRIWNYNQRAG